MRHHGAVHATTILTLVAAMLVGATVWTVLRGTGSTVARRTWMLVAAIFLAVTMWLRLRHG